MTPKKAADADDDDSLGVLDDTGSLDAASLDLLGGTAQVSVAFPVGEEDDLDDDDVVDDEIEPLAAASAATASAATAPAEEAPAQKTTPAVDSPAVQNPVVPGPVSQSSTDHAPAATESVQKAPAVKASVVKSSAEKAPATKSAAAKVPAKGKKPDPPATTNPSAKNAGAERPAGATSTSAGFTGSSRPTTPTSPSAPRMQAPRPKESPVTSDDRVAAPRQRPEEPLTSKRFDDLGDGSRESADLLTADRLLDPHRVAKPEPEGAWSQLLYTLSGRLINIGDGRRARERKQLRSRISAPLTGAARFVPVLSRKGGVGKTTVTALLGMALADARDDRVIAVDANPDRGTLAERVGGTPGASVRDLVRKQKDIRGYHDVPHSWSVIRPDWMSWHLTPTRAYPRLSATPTIVTLRRSPRSTIRWY